MKSNKVIVPSFFARNFTQNGFFSFLNRVNSRFWLTKFWCKSSISNLQTWKFYLDSVWTPFELKLFSIFFILFIFNNSNRQNWLCQVYCREFLLRMDFVGFAKLKVIFWPKIKFSKKVWVQTEFKRSANKIFRFEYLR